MTRTPTTIPLTCRVQVSVPGSIRFSAYRMSEYIWKKQDAVAESCDKPELVKKVLVLYTGGTIGMKFNGGKGTPQSMLR